MPKLKKMLPAGVWPRVVPGCASLTWFTYPLVEALAIVYSAIPCTGYAGSIIQASDTNMSETNKDGTSNNIWTTIVGILHVIMTLW